MSSFNLRAYLQNNWLLKESIEEATIEPDMMYGSSKKLFDALPENLYHLTSEKSVSSILNGELGGRVQAHDAFRVFGTNEGFYFCTTPEMCFEYAPGADEGRDEGSQVILTFRKQCLDPSKIYLDPEIDVGPGDDTEEAAFFYAGYIPGSKVKVTNIRRS